MKHGRKTKGCEPPPSHVRTRAQYRLTAGASGVLQEDLRSSPPVSHIQWPCSTPHSLLSSITYCECPDMTHHLFLLALGLFGHYICVYSSGPAVFLNLIILSLSRMLSFLLLSNNQLHGYIKICLCIAPITEHLFGWLVLCWLSLWTLLLWDAHSVTWAHISESS